MLPLQHNENKTVSTDDLVPSVSLNLKLQQTQELPRKVIKVINKIQISEHHSEYHLFMIQSVLDGDWESIKKELCLLDQREHTLASYTLLTSR